MTMSNPFRSASPLNDNLRFHQIFWRPCDVSDFTRKGYPNAKDMGKDPHHPHLLFVVLAGFTRQMEVNKTRSRTTINRTKSIQANSPKYTLF